MGGRIQFGVPYEDQMDGRAFPDELVTEGPITPGSFIILLDEDALQAIEGHAKKHTNIGGRAGYHVECAGLLAGRPFYDGQRQVTFVVIKQMVETEAESQSPGSVRIVPEGFERAKRHIDALGLRVVGWYHTHPNYGIFLSTDDRTVIRSLFNASWHIALVFDPIRDHIGCFRGVEGERVDDRDENVKHKRNYYVISGWQGFWSTTDVPAAGTGQPPSSSGAEEGVTMSEANSSGGLLPVPPEATPASDVTDITSAILPEANDESDTPGNSTNDQPSTEEETARTVPDPGYHPAEVESSVQDSRKIDHPSPPSPPVRSLKTYLGGLAAFGLALIGGITGWTFFRRSTTENLKVR